MKISNRFGVAIPFRWTVKQRGQAFMSEAIPVRFYCTVMAALCLASQAWAGGVITSPTESNLRAALAGGGTVTFAVDGTIILSASLVLSDNTTIDGSGHNVTLDGGNVVRILEVDHGISLALKNLTLAH